MACPGIRSNSSPSPSVGSWRFCRRKPNCGDRALVAFLVLRARHVLFLLVIALGVVDADRPELVDRHVLDIELIDGAAVVLGGCYVEIGASLSGLPPSKRFRLDDAPDRPASWPERLLEIDHRGAEDQQHR